MKRKEYFKYIFALLLFGTNGIVASHISLTSYEIVLLRTMIGSLLLITIFILTKGKLSFLAHKQQVSFLAVSGIAMGVSWMFLYEAYTLIGVSIASLAYYCGPVIVMMLSPLLFREKLAITKIIGFIAVLVGVFFVNGQIDGKGVNSTGIFYGFMSAVMYAVMVICNKKAKDIKGLENAMLQLFISFVTVAIFVVIKQGPVIHGSLSDVIPVLVLGILNTGIGCYLYFSSIGYLPVQTVALLGYLEPCSAVLFSILYLNENMTIIQVMGAILILGGAGLGELFKSKRNITDYT